MKKFGERKPVILVTGCCGHIGLETINALKKDYRSDQFVIRAGIRDTLKGTEIMKQYGTEIVELDLNKKETVLKAVNSTNKILLILGFSSNPIKQTQNALEAACFAGVKHLVFVSPTGCDGSQLVMAQQYLQAENVIKASTLNYTILRTTFLQENLLAWKEEIRHGKFGLATGKGKFAPVSSRDIGEAAANVLLSDSSQHYGKTYNVTGPQLVDAGEIANIIAKELSIKLELQNSTLQEDAKRLSEAYSPDSYQDFFDLLTLYANNEAAICSQDGEMLIGRKLTPIEDTINANRSKIRHDSRCYSIASRGLFETEWIDSPKI